ncbi:SgcJ/EcaC family oxidoreductase [Massilia sp. PAMC28688]|uniref:YybH family protein n=1 Tax=Massilia sp. PAMC28688 TaxID=2861283 RepID=UPI001C6371BD|nr:SgcJ/EcaC family oxidoreductase [Massilia sp. PAMC28688]QYF94310.1 SgcJ/EcaC family oxidoreductase [Massilia sp. PAMC28688]
MSADEQAIRALIARWLQATHDGNIDEVLALMAPDAIFLTAGQPPMQGHQAFADTLRHVLNDNVVESNSEIDEIEIEGDMAYCRSTLEVTIVSKHGKLPLRRTGHTLTILRKDAAGTWHVTRDANMLA